METVAKLTPDKVDPTVKGKYVSQPMNRIDGKVKVTGEAKFSAEYKLDNIAHASVVYSTISKGSIVTIDTSAAMKVKGVIIVLTHKNRPKIKQPPQFKPGGQSKGSAASDVVVLEDEKIYWDGQPVAVVVADKPEQAEYAASLVKITYKKDTSAQVSFDALKSQATSPKDVLGEPPEVKVGGDAEGALKNAAYSVDNIYHTPRYNHNAIEPHASIAHFRNDGKLVMYDATQYVYGVKNTISAMFAMKPEQVQALAPFVGGGFGGKGSLWMNTMLCAYAAKATGRPVKLPLTREGVFRMVGGRTLSEQRVALGTDKDGKLISLIHTGTTATTTQNNFPEQFSFPARHLYASENIYVDQKIVNLDTIANTFMRAPGESIGTFALESAIDELAYKIKMDPVKLRALNEPEKDPTKNTEFSHRDLKLAYTKGAEKFNWKFTEPRSKRDGEWLIGHGVATAYYPFYRMAATAAVRINADGTAIVKAAAHEMGMGTATVQTQQSADRLALPFENVKFEYGDSDLPQSPVAGGSNQTASVTASITAAVEKLQKDIFDLAQKSSDSPLVSLKFEDIEIKNGGLFSKDDDSKGETYAAILKRANKGFIEAEAPAPAPTEVMKYSMGSYGAQFAEVRVNEVTGEVRVSRWVGSFDTGRVINPKTASSQFRGGIIMGIGMALTEETFFDDRRGRIMNPSLAEYHVPVHADVPHIDVIYNDIPDEHSPLGGHGIGEIGITGTAAAIANAIFNATGKRIRDLPITLDKLMS